MSHSNETHDPRLASWVDAANAPGADFPVQNLPFAVFRRRGSNEAFRGGVAIGDQVLDLAAAHRADAFSGEAAAAAASCSAPSLNAFMAMGPRAWSGLRLGLSRALREGSPMEQRLRGCLVPQGQVEFAVPAQIGDFTDFYASVHHALRVGKQFRPDNPLLPNYKWVPIAYHGRSSSIGVSGQSFRAPGGADACRRARASRRSAPARGSTTSSRSASSSASATSPGSAIAIADAERHVFGLCLLNDWSARDIQAWEYQPLGPFLAKNFASTISPWIVTLEALAPYRDAWTRDASDPQPLAYLDEPEQRASGAIDLQLEAWLETPTMRDAGGPPARLSHTSFRHAYWTIFQMVAHHTVTGCNLQPGDLLGSGTQSGPAPEEGGCLLELSAGGKQPIQLPGGESRTFLEDGDCLILRGWCEKPGAARVGFGECRATVLPAVPL